MELLRGGEKIDSLGSQSPCAIILSAGIFLSETKAQKEKMERIGKKLAFENSFIIEAANKKGGLAIFWNQSWHWSVFSVSNGFIGVKVASERESDWAIWFCHCPAEQTVKKVFWEDLTKLVNSGPSSWVCLGDFNDVTSQVEKKGG